MASQPGDGGARFGVFELDLRAHELRKQGRRVHLQDKPFELLAFLVSRPGQLVTRDELQRHLWHADTFVAFDDNLNAAVRKAREALGDSAESPRFIETVPRHGYRFLAPVEPFPTPESAIPVQTPPHANVSTPAPQEVPRAGQTEPGTWSVPAAAAVAVLLAGLLGFGWSMARTPGTRPADSSNGARDLIRYRVMAPQGHRIPPGGPRLAVSPDGHHVAFVAHVEPAVGRRVWIQSIDAPTPRAVPGTEEAFDVFWSPDSRALAFVAVGMLRTLHLDGGPAVTLGKADSSSGGSWSVEAGLLVTEGAGTGLVLFPPDGGAPRIVTTPDSGRNEKTHRFPQFLPDGQSFIYLAESHLRERSAIYLARLDAPGRTHLLDTPYKAEFVAPDALLFMRNGRLVSQRLDLSTWRLTGAPTEVLPGVFGSANGEAWFSSSSGGVIAYAGPPPPEPRGLTWFDTDGRRVGAIDVPATCVDVALSPDDRQVALGCREAQYGPSDVWAAEIASGRVRRLTSNPAGDGGPVWSPDGRAIAYARARGHRAEADIYLLDPAVAGDTHPILAADGVSEHPTSWSPRGDLLFFQREGNVGKEDLWVWPTRNGERARPWLATPHNEHRAVISPDGRWVAYEADRTGRPEVYVRQLASPDAGEWPVSTRGGRGPKWQRGGHAVYFVSEDWQMTVAAPGPSGTWTDATTRVLFELPGRTQPPGMPPTFDVTADGQRFLVGPPPLAAADPLMTVVLDWRAR
jgi:Tol biopolymer transport system component/DNA-binding winged helix-turn-helix (wHTH) protein